MTYPQQTTRAEHGLRGTLPERPDAVWVYMLGSFEVSVGSHTIEEGGWRLKKAASLVKLLALEPGHRMHREQIMDLLWPDFDSEARTNNLRQALHVVRRTLEPTPAATSRYVERQGEQLVLCPNSPLWVDVEAFEEAVIAARRTLDPAAYQAAIDFYVGDLLPEDRYEHWAEEKREKLRRTYLSLLMELAGLYEGRKEYRLAVEVLGRAVTEEPWYKGVHAGLMRLYAISGQRERALLKQFERLEEVLPRECGTEPKLDEATWEEDRAMTREEVASYALWEEPAPTTVPPEEPPAGGQSPAALTTREKEVAAFIARGLTNRQIAGELTLSERTVDAHLRKILKKLGFRSRSQVAAWVTEQRLPSC